LTMPNIFSKIDFDGDFLFFDKILIK
jgi:hypothetical protein